MKYVGLMNINLQQIHAFLAVAKHMNMTKAAEAIHVSQPLLSQKISSLEYDTGIRLFTRSNRTLKITPAGQYLYEHWNNIIKSIEDTVEAAQMIQKQDEKGVNISFCFGISTQIAIQIMQRVRREFPDLQFSFQMSEIFKMRNELLEQKTDVAVAPNYDQGSLGGSIRHVTIAERNVRVVVASSHPLAKKDRLEWEDLKNYNILCQPASQTGGYEKYISSLCQAHGFMPNYVECNNFFSSTSRMMLGDGILVGVLAPLGDFADDCVQFEMEGTAIPIVMSYMDTKSVPFLDFIDKCRGILPEYF